MGKIILIMLLAVIVAITAIVFINRKYQTVTVNIPSFTRQPRLAPATTSPDAKFIIPNSVLLPVPFTPQAPTANWDQLHNEACEEAGAIMAAAYFAGSTEINLPADYVESEINKLIAWQDRQFGYHLDTTAAETARMVDQVYGLQTKLLDNFTAADLKEELSQNRLLLISENGRLLDNPFYKQPGPIHHMLLIKGFDSDNNFIANDSGTKRGLNYLYTFNTIYAAAADWDHALNTVDGNKKIAIVVWK